MPKDALDGMQTLSPWEELAYRRILDLIYVTDNNLHNDDTRLAWMTKTGREWKKVKAGLLKQNKIYIDDGFIRNNKCNNTLIEVRDFIAQKSHAGTASATKRRNRKLQRNSELANTDSCIETPSLPTHEIKHNTLNNNNCTSTDVPTDVPTGGATGTQREGNQPLATNIDSDTKVSSSPPTPIPDWMPVELWNDYLDMREKKRAKPTNKAVILLIAKLDKWRTKGHDPSEILSKSITSNWTDIFEPKPQYNSTKGAKNENTSRVITKLERAKAALLRSAVAGGYAATRPDGTPTLDGDADAVLPNPQVVWEGTGKP